MLSADSTFTQPLCQHRSSIASHGHDIVPSFVSCVISFEADKEREENF
jgi:hypothetical protein